MEQDKNASFVEKGGLHVVLQFILFGAIICINQLVAIRGTHEVQACGVLIFVFGTVFWAWGMATNVPRPNMFPMPLEGSPLNDNGPYQFVRHPSYLGLICMFTGGSLAFGSLPGAISALLFLTPFFWLKATKEERHMLEVHAAQWEAYKTKVPHRFMPISFGVLAFAVMALVFTVRDNDAKPYQKAVIILSVATCLLAAIQMLYFRKNLYLKSQTSHLLWCLGSSGAVALTNCCAATLESRASYEVYMNLAAVFRCLWVYHYLLLLLSFFQPKGGGGKEEVLQAAGDIMTQASLPPGSYVPAFWLCTGARKYTPGPAFLRGAFRRVEYYIAGTMILACLKLTLHLEGRTEFSADAPCKTEFTGSWTSTALIVLDISVVFMGLSGVLALAKAMEPLLLPSRRALVTLRHRMFVYMQTFTAVQSALIFGVFVPMAVDLCATQRIEGLTIAVEMLLFQVCSHKAFVPLFSWGPWHRMSTLPTQAEMEEMSKFNFLVPVAEMASKFDKDGEEGSDANGNGAIKTSGSAVAV